MEINIKFCFPKKNCFPKCARSFVPCNQVDKVCFKLLLLVLYAFIMLILHL